MDILLISDEPVISWWRGFSPNFKVSTSILLFLPNYFNRRDRVKHIFQEFLSVERFLTSWVKSGNVVRWLVGPISGALECFSILNRVCPNDKFCTFALFSDFSKNFLRLVARLGLSEVAELWSNAPQIRRNPPPGKFGPSDGSDYSHYENLLAAPRRRKRTLLSFITKIMNSNWVLKLKFNL